MGKLKDKTAVITGGNSGIGYATAELFLKEGANVIITGRDQKSLDTAVSKLGKGARSIQSDAGKTADLNLLPEKISGLTSQVDILFANAGVASFSSFAETTEDEFDRQTDIN